MCPCVRSGAALTLHLRHVRAFQGRLHDISHPTCFCPIHPGLTCSASRTCTYTLGRAGCLVSRRKPLKQSRQSPAQLESQGAQAPCLQRRSCAEGRGGCYRSNMTRLLIQSPHLLMRGCMHAGGRSGSGRSRMTARPTTGWPPTPNPAPNVASLLKRMAAATWLSASAGRWDLGPAV